jgi:hypothetical protein
MESINTQDKLYHKHLIRLDDNLNTKLINHMTENDMTLTGVVRRSLRVFLEKETLKHESAIGIEKTIPVK